MNSKLLISLNKALDETFMKREDLERLLRSFSCCRDKGIENFLSERAIEFEQLNKYRTFLYLEEIDEEHYRDRKIELLGYFSLALKVIILPDEYFIRANCNSINK